MRQGDNQDIIKGISICEKPNYSQRPLSYTESENKLNMLDQILGMGKDS